MEWLQNHWQDITLIVTGTISVASLIVKLTPTPKDDEFLAKVISVLKIVSLNKK